jgi:hypothetical protein
MWYVISGAAVVLFGAITTIALVKFCVMMFEPLD